MQAASQLTYKRLLLPRIDLWLCEVYGLEGGSDFNPDDLEASHWRDGLFDRGYFENQ